ncbi:MAG TPA: PEP-CTERM sorting domain-containing protein [Bryobacteraceae bacterium]|nr:PEP-CTERM sorting domain-containing protein [Bryobacteraceae bacterium]
MKTRFGLTIASALLLAASVVKADSLYGTQVTLTVDYPTLGNIISNAVTKTVGSGIEFPSGTLTDTLTGTYFIGENIDIGKSTIDIAAIQNATALSGAFNGYVFNFTGATIVSASLDPASTFTSSQVPITFGPNYVAENEEGLTLTTSSNILIDLNFTTMSTSTPEPQSWLLMLGGSALLLGFILARRRSVVL